MFTRVHKATLGHHLSTRAVLAAALCTLVLLLCSPGMVQAQIYYGSITGTVTDSSGAVISGAMITVKNVGTGATYTATSSDSGVYALTQLPVGAYEVRVKQQGFKEYVTTGVEVHTSTPSEVNAKLDLGAASETVTVEASDVQVQTSSASVGEVVEGQQVRELPLNGENFMNLVTLSPGVSPANDFNARDKGLSGGSDFSVNGNPYTNNLFLVDGVNNNDVGSNRTILVYPSVDTIAEFKMIRNSYGPEYGQASGAIISITTKSGQNQFHGGVFYAGRNDALDANDWFSNQNKTGKAELRRNDWGYNVSGPILKDKLFFWWNQEWNREVRGVSVSACEPTQPELNGDFSQNFSGATAPSTANPNGVIATDQCGAQQPAEWLNGVYTSLIPKNQQGSNPFVIANPSQQGQLLAAFYPLPNRATLINGHNWVSQEHTDPDWSEWNVRIDYDVTKKNRATFRYTNDTWKDPGPVAGYPNTFWGDSVFPTINSDWSQPSKSVMGKLSTQISSSMVNDVEFGYGHNAIITNFSGTGATVNGTNYSAVGLVQAINAQVPTAWPASLKTLPSFINGSANWGGLQPYGSGQTMWVIAPYGNHEDLYALQDNLSKVQGNHIWKVGAYYSTNAKIENNAGGADQPGFNASNGGLATVGGIPTGNQLANLLLPGQTFNSTESSINQTARVIWHDFEWYVGDSWKVRRNVTVEYGFRWSFFRQPYAENNEWASFSLADWSAAEAKAHPSDACNGVLVVVGTNPCGAAAAQLASLGITLPLSSGTPGPNRALANQANHDIAPRFGVAWDIFGDGKTALRVGGGQFFQRASVGPDESLASTSPFVIGANDIRSLTTPAPLNNPSVSPSAAKELRGITQNSWQYNVSLEREFVRNMTLQVGYVGNVGIHLRQGADLNMVPGADWSTTAFLSGAALNAYRPAFNFGTIQYDNFGGHASYNSLQALYRWQLGNFSTIQAAYTYSHSIANVELDNSSNSINQQALTDPANPRLDRGNTNINRPNIFVANEVFYLPKLANKDAFVRQTLGGWELNSIITITSGTSLSVFSSGASGATVNNIKSTLSSIQGSGFNNNNRPDATGVNCNANENGDQILNPAAFTFVGYNIGTVGTAARGICRGPTYKNWDMQMAKNWYFKEHYRIKFAMDFFNILNHANFYGNNLEGYGFSASNLVCGTAAPCQPGNTVVTGSAPQGSGWGQASAVHPGRELQYSLRFYF